MLTPLLSMLDRLSGWWWVKVPSAVGRLSPGFAAMLAEPALPWEPRRFRSVGPPLAVAIGLIVGSTHWTMDPLAPDAFTSSFPLLAAIVVVSGLSQAIGLWFLAGYVIGDLFFYEYNVYYATAPGADRWLSGSALYLAILIGYLLLWQLISLGRIGDTLRRDFTNRRWTSALATHPLAMGVVQGVAHGLAVLAWSGMAPIMIRPLYTWANSIYPPIGAMAQVQGKGSYLALLGFAAAFVRGWSVATAAGTMTGSYLPSSRSHTSGRFAGRAFTGLYLLLMLAGAITSAVDLLLATLFIAAILQWRNVVGRSDRWVRWCSTVPLIVRLAVAAGLSYAIAVSALTLVTPGDSFRPLLVLSAVSLAISVTLAPVRRQPVPRVARPGAIVALVIVGLLTTADVAFGDNCSGLTDCFGQITGMAAAAIFIAAMLFAQLLFGHEPPPVSQQPVSDVTLADLERARELAELAKAAYSDYTPAGYSRVRGWDGRQARQWSNAEGSDFKAVLFETPDGRLVLAFPGTRRGSISDWSNNAQNYAGGNSPDVHDGVEVARQVESQYPGREVEYTGHSKGAGPAVAASRDTGRPATTFNPAGTDYGASGGYADSNVTNYRVSGDILTTYDTGGPGPAAGGTNIILPPVDASGAVPGPSGVERHQMDSVIRALNAQIGQRRESASTGDSGDDPDN